MLIFVIHLIPESVLGYLVISKVPLLFIDTILILLFMYFIPIGSLAYIRRKFLALREVVRKNSFRKYECQFIFT